MDVDDALRLAEQQLADSLPRRWRHVQAVAAETTRIATAIGYGDGVVCAAWLHDLGYSPAVATTGFHPLDGARYLHEHGWPVEVCRLVANHTDAITLADMLGLGAQLRAEFPDTATPGRDVLWTADATTGPDGDAVSLDERIAEITARYGADDVVTCSMIASRPALSAALERTHARLLAAAATTVQGNEHRS